MNIDGLRKETLSLVRSVDNFTLMVSVLDDNEDFDNFNNELQKMLFKFSQMFNIDFCQHCANYFLLEDLKTLLCEQCEIELRSK